MKRRPFVVAISGDPVSGKSSAIKALMKRYEEMGFSEDTTNGKVMVRFAAGQLFRDIAEKASVTVSELTELAKHPKNTIETLMEFPNADKEYFASFGVNTSKSIDIFIDEYMLKNVREAIEKFSGYEEAIIIADSRIVGLLMKREREEVFNVRFSVLPEIAAKRLLLDAKNRKNEISREADQKAALASVKARTVAERRRFIQVYSNDLRSRTENARVDLQNLANYDLLIDTSGVTTNEVVSVLQNCLEKARKGRYFNKEWRGTKYIRCPERTCRNNWHLLIEEAKVLKVDGECYALSAMEHISFLNRQGADVEEKNGTEEGYKLFPIDVLAEDDELFFYHNESGETEGTTAREFIENMYIKKGEI